MFEIDVTDSAVKATGNLVSRLQDLSAPLGESGALLERKAVIRFVKQQDPGGKPWAPLRPETLAKKKTGFTYRNKQRVIIPSKFRGTILRETGSLAASIAFAVSGNEVRVKPSVDYGIFGQLGTRKQAARPFMGFEADDAAQIGQIFRDHLEGR